MCVSIHRMVKNKYICKGMSRYVIENFGGICFFFAKVCYGYLPTSVLDMIYTPEI